MLLSIPLSNTFHQLAGLLSQLENAAYTSPCSVLSNATIGQHVRHIIELFQCLETGYAEGIVNYESRKRDFYIETDIRKAEKMLREIQQCLEKPNKELLLESEDYFNKQENISIPTNYYREVVYNLEHAIHHMAMIKIGVKEVSSIVLPDKFGTAFSTIKYRSQCAQ